MLSDRTKKILTNEYIFSVFAKFFTIFIGIAHSALVARYLGAEYKGINAYISSAVGVCSIIVTFGMHQAYPYFRKKYGKERIYNDYVALIEVLYFVLILLAFALCIFWVSSVETKAIILLTPLYGYTRITGYVVLVESPNQYNKWETLISFFSLGYIILLYLFTERNMILALSLLAILDIARAIIYTSILRVIPYITARQIPLVKELIKYGFFPMVALLMTTLNYKIDTIMLRNSVLITDAMVGVYSVGITLSDKIALIPDSLKGVIVSKLSKGAGEEEVAKVSRLCFVCSILLCMGTIVLGKPFINILYGREYSDAYSIIVITAGGAVAIGYFKIIAQYNIVNKRQVLNVLMLSVAVLLDIILNLILIPVWGIYGAAIATCISNIVCGIVFVVWFCKKSGIPISKMLFIQTEDLQFLSRFRGNKGD